MKSRHACLRVLVFLAAVGLLGCVSGPSTTSKKAVNALLAAQNYAGAQAYLEKAKEGEYGKKNMVLYYLDHGSVLHHAGKYQESDASFDKAQTRIDELYTKSITQAGGLMLLNDSTMDYAGEPFERVLTNVFRALNFVFLGKPEEAVVESRKAEEFLTRLNASVGKAGVYKDDAFARYLDALLYDDEGKRDDARISMEAANAAYAAYKADYGTPVPNFSLPEDTQRKSGELVFIHYNGVAPRKVSKTWQIAWGQALAIANSDEGSKDQRFANGLRAGILGNSITVSYPAYVQDPFIIANSEVSVDSGPATGTILMSDISAIATKNLADRVSVIKARSIARAMVKYVIAEAASRAAAKACDKMPGGYFAIQACKLSSRAVSHGAAAASESADTRAWSALPSQIRMARVKLPAGRHEIRVFFKNAVGAIVSSFSFKDVEIQRAKRTYLAHRTAI